MTIVCSMLMDAERTVAVAEKGYAKQKTQAE
jgi:hypothetical protein